MLLCQQGRDGYLVLSGKISQNWALKINSNSPFLRMERIANAEIKHTYKYMKIWKCINCWLILNGWHGRWKAVWEEKKDGGKSIQIVDWLEIVKDTASSAKVSGLDYSPTGKNSMIVKFLSNFCENNMKRGFQMITLQFSVIICNLRTITI